MVGARRARAPARPRSRRHQRGRRRRPTTTCSPGSTAGARCTFDEARRRRMGRTPPRTAGGLGGAPPRAARRLATRAHAARRPAGRARPDLPAPLVLVPRRQSRKLNSQIDFLGEPAEVIAASRRRRPRQRRRTVQPVVVRSAHGELTGIAKVDAVGARGCDVGAARPPPRQRQRAHRQGRHRPVTGMVRYSGIPVTVAPAQ